MSTTENINKTNIEYDIESCNDISKNKILPIEIPIITPIITPIIRPIQQELHQNLINQVIINTQSIQKLTSQIETTEREMEENYYFEFCGKLLILLLFIIIVFPIIICDMYYAYNDDSCVNEYPKNLNMNMKQYLLGCAYSSIIIMVMICIILCIASKENIDIIHTCIFENCGCLSYIMKMFTIIWHILGAIIFWGTLYPENLCNKSASTYFFISLIIKLISCSTIFFKSNKNT
jgi:hypothetical protein